MGWNTSAPWRYEAAGACAWASDDMPVGWVPAPRYPFYGLEVWGGGELYVAAFADGSSYIQYLEWSPAYDRCNCASASVPFFYSWGDCDGSASTCEVTSHA